MSARKRLWFFVPVLMLAVGARSFAQSAGSPFGPYSYNFDFESGSVGPRNSRKQT